MTGNKYHSIQGASNQQELLYGDLKLVNSITGQNLVQTLIHSVIDHICGRTIPVDFSIYGLQTIRTLFERLAVFVSRVVGRELKREQIVEDLKTAAVQDDSINTIADAIVSRYQDIKRELTEKLSSISSSSLTDFDWKMNLILSSDKINSVNENVLMLNLTIDHHEEKKEQLLVELSKKDLDQLLSQFEQINSVVQSLKI
ncbi:COMM domain-containing protein 8 [Heterostelium album PN500]|uniref:COMM domain-containing protein 8 n=1 Tax=Heterostelium pallidum (strain ATCC 26659 / Pp 5 / PN500) TaxID=670386 RepID=D3BCM0_HETP5|nr:COMM domain-containing protein 8 [Heterostelium album PN500]EFA80662.1 COMM domain-containing protein 8 [Heterostelium album PN500]|eukprot:XP_020432782.1 COMM domain-containing protein 8 [Heterostelium album PN500]